MKKTYYIPTIEIVKFDTERLMDMADMSERIHPAPPRRDPAF